MEGGGGLSHQKGPDIRRKHLETRLRNTTNQSRSRNEFGSHVEVRMERMSGGSGPTTRGRERPKVKNRRDHDEAKRSLDQDRTRVLRKWASVGLC